MKKLVMSTAIVAAMLATTAQAYQNEATGTISYAHSKDKAWSDNNEAAAIGGSFTYFLNPVENKRGPLAEDAFTTQTSNITVAYSYAQGASDLDDVKAHVFGGGAEFYIPSSALGLGNTTLYAAAAIGRPKFEGDNSNVYGYGAEIGFFPMQDLLLTAGVVGNGNAGKDNDPNATIRAKYLTQLDANFVNTEASIVFGDHHNTLYQASADYYLDNTFSVGAGFAYASLRGGKDPYAININARKFVAENLSLQGGISYGKGMVDAQEGVFEGIVADVRDNAVGVNLGATLRF
ncbi:putative porin [Alkanindiges sp. WGS2144]|uniref:putative porin n=1 Tax=Alkanindiges sp. WGS2144 TaxID=3366808 RepID=UPI0037526985